MNNTKNQVCGSLDRKKRVSYTLIFGDVSAFFFFRKKKGGKSYLGIFSDS
jgi:hypothetical protein